MKKREKNYLLAAVIQVITVSMVSLLCGVGIGYLIWGV